MLGNYGHSSISTGYQPTFPQNHSKAAGIHSQYEPPSQLNTSAGKAAETSLDKILETIRTFNESLRQLNELNEFNRSTADPSNEVAKFLMVQAFNLFRGKHSHSNPAKKEILPAGYRISLCNTCLSGWE